MAGSGDLYDAVEAYFNVCLAALADTPGGAPPCAYISEGVPLWDTCPCLVVYAGGPAIADTFPLQPVLAPGHRAALGISVNLVTITALVLRCATVIDETGSLPQPAAHAAVARQTAADAWAIWNHVRQAKRDETLFPPRERELFMEAAAVQNQEGGCTGWSISLRTELDGYHP